MATHRGYDSDHPRVKGDVGKAGVAIDSVLDMKVLFDGIPLDKVSVSMTMNGAVLPILAGYRSGGGTGCSTGSVVRHGSERHPQRVHGPQHLHLPPAPACGSLVTSSRIARSTCPVQHHQHLGLSHPRSRCRRSLELAYTLADGKNIRTALAAGLDIDAFAPACVLLGIGMNFYMEIAKLRAARLLWQEIVSEFKPKNPKSPCYGPIAKPAVGH